MHVNSLFTCKNIVNNDIFYYLYISILIYKEFKLYYFYSIELACTYMRYIFTIIIIYNRKKIYTLLHATLFIDGGMPRIFYEKKSKNLLIYKLEFI